VTQTTQKTETQEQKEEFLWAEYMDVRASEVRSWQLEEEYWREYVMTGLSNDSIRRLWRKYAAKTRDLNYSARNAYKAWMRVAYPLYDIPVDVKNEGDQHSS
jgi:hypothetical protein